MTLKPIMDETALRILRANIRMDVLADTRINGFGIITHRRLTMNQMHEYVGLIEIVKIMYGNYRRKHGWIMYFKLKFYLR